MRERLTNIDASLQAQRQCAMPVNAQHRGCVFFAEAGGSPAFGEFGISGQNELDKALLILYLEERPYREIAEILGITETNVATKLSRIKGRLKQHLLTFNNSLL